MRQPFQQPTFANTRVTPSPTFANTRVTPSRGLGGTEFRFRHELRSFDAAKSEKRLPPTYMAGTEFKAPTRAQTARVFASPAPSQSLTLAQMNNTQDSISSGTTVKVRARSPNPFNSHQPVLSTNFSNTIGSSNWSMSGNRSAWTGCLSRDPYIFGSRFQGACFHIPLWQATIPS